MCWGIVVYAQWVNVCCVGWEQKARDTYSLSARFQGGSRATWCHGVLSGSQSTSEMRLCCGGESRLKGRSLKSLLCRLSLWSAISSMAAEKCFDLIRENQVWGWHCKNDTMGSKSKE